MAQIAPSLLAADFARLGEGLRIIKEAGAPIVHVDVMDGHFVPDITIGQPVIRSLRKATDLELDLHLLVERPERYVPEFIAAGADRIAIHAEATLNLHKALAVIRAGGCRVGLALNPSTAVEAVADALDEIDYLLLLSADLGFAHSSFLPRTVSKIRAACALRSERGLGFAVQVEGSISLEHVEGLVQAGADILVADSDIFQKDPQARLADMMRRAATARQTS